MLCLWGLTLAVAAERSVQIGASAGESGFELNAQTAFDADGIAAKAWIALRGGGMPKAWLALDAGEFEVFAGNGVPADSGAFRPMNSSPLEGKPQTGWRGSDGGSLLWGFRFGQAMLVISGMGPGQSASPSAALQCGASLGSIGARACLSLNAALRGEYPDSWSLKSAFSPGGPAATAAFLLDARAGNASGSLWAGASGGYLRKASMAAAVEASLSFHGGASRRSGISAANLAAFACGSSYELPMGRKPAKDFEAKAAVSLFFGALKVDLRAGASSRAALEQRAFRDDIGGMKRALWSFSIDGVEVSCVAACADFSRNGILDQASLSFTAVTDREGISKLSAFAKCQLTLPGRLLRRLDIGARGAAGKPGTSGAYSPAAESGVFEPAEDGEPLEPTGDAQAQEGRSLDISSLGIEVQGAGAARLFGHSLAFSASLALSVLPMKEGTGWSGRLGVECSRAPGASVSLRIATPRQAYVIGTAPESMPDITLSLVTAL